MRPIDWFSVVIWTFALVLCLALFWIFLVAMEGVF